MTASESAAAPQWIEPLTGPGVAVNHGYNFAWADCPLLRFFGKSK